VIPARGRIYRADMGNGLKPFLVVSNNRRNQQLDSFLAVRITTTVKVNLPSIVILGTHEPVVGRILCDEIDILYREEIKADLGALSRTAMEDVALALRHALSI
jgi:mRNA interferase MazF